MTSLDDRQRQRWRIVFGWFALASMVLVTASAESTADNDYDDWPMRGGNLQRTSSLGAITGPGTGEMLWTHETPYGVDQPPAYADGRIFLAYGGWSEGGGLEALDAVSGHVLWSRNDLGPSYLQPLVYNGMVLIGTAENDGQKGRVIVIDAEEGDIVWSRKFNGPVAISSVENSIAYVVEQRPHSYNGTIWALDLDSGDSKWSMETVSGNVLKSDDILLISQATGTVAAFNAKNRAALWEFETGYSFGNPIAISSGVVVVFAGDFVAGIDLDSGQERWRTEAGGSWSNGDSVIYQNEVFVTSDPLRILDLFTGNLIQEVHAHLPVGLAVSQGHVYASTYAGDLRSPYESGLWRVKALDPGSGTIHWRQEIPYTYGSPIIVNGILYQPFLNSEVGDHDESGGVIALDAGYLAALEQGDIPDASANGDNAFPIPTTGFTFLAGIVLLISLFNHKRRNR